MQKPRCLAAGLFFSFLCVHPYQNLTGQRAGDVVGCPSISPGGFGMPLSKLALFIVATLFANAGLAQQEPTEKPVTYRTTFPLKTYGSADQPGWGIGTYTVVVEQLLHKQPKVT